jgi:prefoldin subunit 5
MYRHVRQYCKVARNRDGGKESLQEQVAALQTERNEMKMQIARLTELMDRLGPILQE